jgi:hypothetical protein
MFLVRDPRYNFLVFTHEDPRTDGYLGAVESDVTLHYPLAVHEWPDGARCPEIVVGVRGPNRKEYRVFRFDEDRRHAGYDRVPGTPLVYHSWTEYALRQMWEGALKELPEWVTLNSGAIPSWISLPTTEQKHVAESLERLRREKRERWIEMGVRRLDDSEPTYLLRVSPELVLYFKLEDDGPLVVIENFARQETLDRFFATRKESAAKS